MDLQKKILYIWWYLIWMYMKYISLILSEFFNKKINNFYFNIIEYYFLRLLGLQMPKNIKHFIFKSWMIWGKVAVKKRISRSQNIIAHFYRFLKKGRFIYNYFCWIDWLLQSSFSFTALFTFELSQKVSTKIQWALKFCFVLKFLEKGEEKNK